MKTKNKFYRFFSVSKLIGFIAILLLTGSQYGFAALGQGILVVTVTSLSYLVAAVLEFVYFLNVIKFNISRKLYSFILFLFSIINIALAIVVFIFHFMEGVNLETAQIVLRFIPIAVGILLCFIIPLDMEGYKDFKKAYKEIKKTGDKSMLESFLNDDNVAEQSKEQ